MKKQQFYQFKVNITPLQYKHRYENKLTSISMFIQMHPQNILQHYQYMIRNRNRLCEKCQKSKLFIVNGVPTCKNKNCGFVETDLIAYTNQITDKDAGDGNMQRYSFTGNLLSTMGETKKEKKQILNEARIENSVSRGLMFITQCCELLKINLGICDQAKPLLFAAVEVLENSKEKGKSREDSESDSEESQKEAKCELNVIHKNALSIKRVAAYCLYSSCLQNNLLFEENRITKYFRISDKKWRETFQELTPLLRDVIPNLPKTGEKGILLKLCSRRHINKQDEEAMVEMCDRIHKYSNVDARPSTIAALVFWKICQFSTNYHDRINLAHLCKNHERLIQQNKQELVFNFFDVTADHVRKVYRDHISKDFFKRYLPTWKNRIALEKDNRGHYIDYE